VLREDELAAGDRGLVEVARAGSEAEAELIQGLLSARGVPSVALRRPRVDAPGFLIAGPRDILVPSVRASDAHDALLKSEPGSCLPATHASDPTRRVLAGLLVAVAVVALIACLGADLFG